MATPLVFASDAVIQGLSTTGTALVIVMCAAQLPTFRLVAQHRLDLDKVSYLPTLGQLANFVTWTLYGALGANNSTIVIVNVLGICFAFLNTSLFLWEATPARRLSIVQLLCGFAACAAIVEGSVLGSLAAGSGARKAALAWVAIVCNVVMYAAPLGAMHTALATMDPTAIPLLLTTASLLCSFCWMLYGLFIADYYVMGPNVAGAALCFVQLLVAAFVIARVRLDPEAARRRVQHVEKDFHAHIADDRHAETLVSHIREHIILPHMSKLETAAKINSLIAALEKWAHLHHVGHEHEQAASLTQKGEPPSESPPAARAPLYPSPHADEDETAKARGDARTPESA